MAFYMRSSHTIERTVPDCLSLEPTEILPMIASIDVDQCEYHYQKTQYAMYQVCGLDDLCNEVINFFSEDFLEQKNQFADLSQYVL